MLLNAGAGTASHTGADGLLGDLEAALQALDVSADLEICSGPDLKRLAEAALARARSAEIDAVVVGGGDGSIRTVAGVLAQTGVPLGILPLGTLNHFAKDLGIPLHLKEAAEVIAKGEKRTVDLAEVNGETFINNSSIGIYP
ncbi:MAG: diacylglycerol kinase family protein, partial [Methyloceanibacter sp.]